MELLLLLLVTILSQQPSTSSRVCPQICKCHSSWLRGISSVVVDCSRRKLTTIPQKRVPKRMTSFVLNENFITELPKFVFKRFKYLKELYLYKNFLTKIDKDAFRGLIRLKELSLHSNQIKKIENGTFAHLKNLKKLYLFTNFIQEINPGTFTGLKNVKYVFLHENLLRFIPKDTFVPLKELEVLTLYRNYLQTLYSGSFNGLKSITKMFLHENKLSSIQFGAFGGLTTLKTLQIGNNLLSDITNETLYGLENLQEMNLDNNRISYLEHEMFGNTLHLKTLVLLGNRIEKISPGTFRSLKELQLLSMSANNLTHLRPGMFAGLGKLTKLFLQNNLIEWIDPYSFQGLMSLQHLYLFRNRLYYIQENTFFGLSSLSELNLGVNNITGLANGAFLGLPRLSSLQLNSNKLKMLQNGAFAGLRRLDRLVLYFNNIKYVNKDWYSGLNRLRRLVWYPPLALVRTSKILRKLKSNSLHCDCNVKWTKRWLKKKIQSSAIFCTTPTYLLKSNVTRVADRYLKCSPISVTVLPSFVMADEMENVYLKCDVNIAANFTWMYNGTSLKSNYYSFQMTSGILLLREMTRDRAGQYTCIASSEVGMSAATSLVQVGVKPHIEQTDDVIFIKRYEEMVVLPCQVSGYPPPLNKWYKDGAALKYDSPNVFISLNQSLVIAKASSLDAGRYTCEARNAIGVDVMTINVVYDHRSSPCQPVCGFGFSCMMRFECFSKNQTRARCTEVDSIVVAPAKLDAQKAHEVDESSADGSGNDINVITDDEDGDVNDNVVETGNIKYIGSGRRPGIPTTQ